MTNLIRKEVIFNWTPRCQKSFDELKELLCAAPVLLFPNFKEEFTSTTDASNQGLRAVLSQQRHPCLFISSTLNKVEENYSTSEEELSVIVWAVKRSRQYLLGNPFKMQTNHKA